MKLQNDFSIDLLLNFAGLIALAIIGNIERGLSEMNEICSTKINELNTDKMLNMTINLIALLGKWNVYEMN